MRTCRVILLVLGLVSGAQAGLILTVGGSDPGGEIAPQTSLVLGMAVEAGADLMGYDVQFLVISGPGALNGGSVTWPTPLTLGNQLTVNTASEVRTWAAQDAFLLDPPVAGFAQLVDNVALTLPEDPATPVVIVLYNPTSTGTVVNDAAVPAGELDRLTITPEPGVMGLLGLGGLALARRRRKS